MRTLRTSLWVAVSAVLLVGSRVQAVQLHFIDFEGLASLTAVTNQYSSQHATFSNATILTAGVSLNDIDYPPHSGSNVLYNNSGPMRIDFASTAYDWSAYLTYDQGVVVNAWDEFNNLIISLTTANFENYTSSTNPFPNDLIALSSAVGFRTITIEGWNPSGSIIMDDMSYSLADDPSAVPEPATLVLFAGGLAVSGLTAVRRKFRARR